MNITQNLNNLLNNKTFVVVITLFIALYSALIAPALPNSVILFFDSIIGKLIFLFLIAFVASKNIQVALMISLGYIFTLQLLTTRINKEHFENPTETLSIDTLICKFASNLSPVSDPKKDDVLNMDAIEFADKFAVQLTNLDNSYTPDMIKNAINNDLYKNKKVSEICAKVNSSSESFDDYDDAIVKADSIKQKCGDEANCKFPQNGVLKYDKSGKPIETAFTKMCKKSFNINVFENKGKRYEGNDFKDFDHSCTVKYDLAVQTAKDLKAKHDETTVVKPPTSDGSTTTSTSEPSTSDPSTKSDTKTDTTTSTSSTSSTGTTSTTEKFHDYDYMNYSDYEPAVISKDVENFDNYGVIPSNNYFDNSTRLMYAPLQI